MTTKRTGTVESRPNVLHNETAPNTLRGLATTPRAGTAANIFGGLRVALPVRPAPRQVPVRMLVAAFVLALILTFFLLRGSP